MAKVYTRFDGDKYLIYGEPLVSCGELDEVYFGSVKYDPETASFIDDFGGSYDSLEEAMKYFALG